MTDGWWFDKSAIPKLEPYFRSPAKNPLQSSFEVRGVVSKLPWWRLAGLVLVDSCVAGWQPQDQNQRLGRFCQHSIPLKPINLMFLPLLKKNSNRRFAKKLVLFNTQLLKPIWLISWDILGGVRWHIGIPLQFTQTRPTWWLAVLPTRDTLIVGFSSSWSTVNAIE